MGITLHTMEQSRMYMLYVLFFLIFIGASGAIQPAKVWLVETADKTPDDKIEQNNNGHKRRKMTAEKTRTDYSLESEDWMDESIEDESEWGSYPPAGDPPAPAAQAKSQPQALEAPFWAVPTAVPPATPAVPVAPAAPVQTAPAQEKPPVPSPASAPPAPVPALPASSTPGVYD